MKYLAYGANMDAEIMCHRCPGAKMLGTGKLGGWRLMFKGEEPFAYATIEEWLGYSVPYVLWEISEEDERKLDRFEGYPKHYKKFTAAIDYDDETCLAMFYAKDEGERVGQPMTHYVEVISAAYDLFKFDRSILDEALRLSNDYYQRGF